MNIMEGFTKQKSERMLFEDEDKINNSYTEPQSSTKLGYDDY